MADVSKINGYNLKDASARQGLNNKANKSDIPTKTSQLTNDSEFATQTYVRNEIANAQLSGEDGVDLSGYATKDELNNKANKSDIPTKTSQLTNDSGYATQTYVKNEIANAQLSGDDGVDLSGYATKDELNNKANKSEIPTKVSQLTNDKNYLTSVPSEYVTETELNQKGYITQHQDISHLATKEELSKKQNTLISGINIKTINGISLLGDGDIEIKGDTGSGSDDEDILLGTLPMEITENFCYIISPTNATISTGQGVPNVLSFYEQIPYLKSPNVTCAVIEVLGSSTIKVGNSGNGKNFIVDVPKPSLTNGETYTMAFRVVDYTEDMATAKVKPYVKWQGGTTFQISSSNIANNSWMFKSFTAEEEQDRIVIGAAANSAFTTDTYYTVEVRIYQGSHTELPSGASFDILAETKYNVDGYKGSTLSAVNGETVYLYQIDTSNSEIETDNGGVIFFGDSIMDFSNIPNMYSKRTGKPVIDCSVGGTRMSDSRDEGNAYKPYDMASIATAITNNNFTDVIEGGKNNAFTTLATANVGGYKAVILEFGTNDYSAEVPFEGETIDTIEGALKFILRTFMTKYPNIRVVVLSTLQYITLGTGNESGVPVHPDGSVWEMNEIIKNVCESDEFCVPFIDMYHKFGQNPLTRNYLNADGVHLTSPYGVQRYLDILVGQLNALGI